MLALCDWASYNYYVASSSFSSSHTDWLYDGTHQALTHPTLYGAQFPYVSHTVKWASVYIDSHTLLENGLPLLTQHTLLGFNLTTLPLRATEPAARHQCVLYGALRTPSRLRWVMSVISATAGRQGAYGGGKTWQGPQAASRPWLLSSATLRRRARRGRGVS